MTRFTIAVALFAASVTLVGHAVGQDEPKSKPLVPTIKEIMNEAHKCRTAYITDVRKELVKDEPDWYAVESRSRDAPLEPLQGSGHRPSVPTWGSRASREVSPLRSRARSKAADMSA